MPSASTKAESKASPEVLNPIKIAVQVVEKKVRNLEKRKGKLDGYKEKKAQGSTLSTEQEEAISRYNGVVLNLELAKELHKQMLQINVDAEKAQKKQLKRERAERVMQDMRRTRELLNIQNILDSMGGEQVRDDFTEGRKGAVKLTEDNLNHLDELYKLISPTRETEEPSYEEQLAKASEHLSRLLDAADKPVLNTTYKDLKGVLDSINECGYFSNQNKEEEPATAAAEEEAAGDAEEGSSGAKETQEQKEEDEQEFVVVESGDLPEPESEEVASSLPPMVAQTTVPDREPELQQQQQQEQPQQPQQQQQQQQQPQPQQPEAAFVDDSFFSTIYANKTRPFSEIVSSVQGNFNFLQDSEIDMDAPQMDPAVVALAPHPIPHPPSQQATESSLAPQSYGQGLMNEEQQTQQQQQVSQHASLSASQQAQVSQQQQQTPPPQQYTATAVSQAPSSSIVNQADLENTYSAPSDYSQNLMSQNHPASALHSTQLADSGAAGSQLSFGSMPNSSSMGEAQASDVPAAIPMPNQTPYGNSQSAQQQPSQQQQQQSSHQNQGMSSGHPGYPSSSVNQSYSQQQAAELSQTEDFSSEQVNNVAGYDDNTKKFSMNANAAVFQSMYHNPNSVQQGQGMQQGMGSGSEDGKSDSQQQNEYQGSNSYGNGFQRGGGNRGNSRGSYNGRGGRGGMSNGFRGNSRGGGGGNQYNSRGNYSNGRGNNRGAFQGFPPRSDYRPEGGYQGFNGGFGGFNNKRGGSGGGAPSRGGTLRGGGGAMRGGPPRGGSRGGRGSFNGNSNRSNMGQQQQPQQATA